MERGLGVGSREHIVFYIFVFFLVFVFVFWFFNLLHLSGMQYMVGGRSKQVVSPCLGGGVKVGIGGGRN